MMVGGETGTLNQCQNFPDNALIVRNIYRDSLFICEMWPSIPVVIVIVDSNKYRSL